MQFELDVAFIRKYLESGKILDYGCGTGEFGKYLNWDGAIYGIEINQNACKMANRNGIITCDSVPRDLDACVFRGVIQHIDEPFKTLKNVSKQMKSGTYIFFCYSECRINSL